MILGVLTSWRARLRPSRWPFVKGAQACITPNSAVTTERDHPKGSAPRLHYRGMSVPIPLACYSEVSAVILSEAKNLRDASLRSAWQDEMLR